MAEQLEGSSRAGRRNSDSESEENDHPAKRWRSWFHSSSSSSSSTSSNKKDIDGSDQESVNPSTKKRGNGELEPDLLNAVYKQQLELIKSLIQLGAPVSSVEPKYPQNSLMILICKYSANTRQQKSNQMDILNVFLENGASVNQKNSVGQTPLHFARSAEMVKFLLEKGASIEGEGRAVTPLFAACQRFTRSIEVIAALLEAGACVNGNDGSPPLNVAYHLATKLLLQNGADVNLVDSQGRSALFRHSDKPNDLESITLLLEYGASINCRDKHGLTPLHLACRRGLNTTVELLLRKGASPHEADNSGETPIFCAARKTSCTDEIIKMLLAHGALINLQNSNGRTPLHVCRQSSTILLQNGAAVNVLDEKHETPLFAACRRTELNSDGFVAALLQLGACVNVKNTEGETPLHAACYYLHSDTVSLLLRHGAAVNELNNKHESPLFGALKTSCPEQLINALMDSGADINLKNCDGRTPLHLACYKGEQATNLIKMLLRKGALVNELDNEQASPLFIAFSRRTRVTELITTLLENGASVNVQNTKGDTLFHILSHRSWKSSNDTSLREHYLGLTNRLLQKGAIVNGVNRYDRTPLESAVKVRNIALIRCLLNNGATVNRKNALGETPLHYACGSPSGGDQDVCLALLQHGASVNAKNVQGLTPFDETRIAAVPVLLHYGTPHCLGWGCADKRHHVKHSLVTEFINTPQTASDLKEKIGQTAITYWDLLHLKVPRSDFEEVLSTVTQELLKTIYPTSERYQNMLYCSLLKIKRLQRMDECSCLFNFTIPFLPPEIAYKIFSYLDLGDLTVLFQILNPIKNPVLLE